MKLRKRLFSLVAIIGVLLLVNGNGFATDRYVDDDYPTCCDGSCYSSDIQSAITASGSGDTVYVCPGTYTEQITMKDGVDVISAGDDTTTDYTDPYDTSDPYTTTVLLRAYDTIIDGGGTGPVVEFDGRTTSFDSDTTLDGFTVQNVDSTSPYAIIGITADSGHAYVTNCIVRDNDAGNKAGIGMCGRWDGSDCSAIGGTGTEYDTAPHIDNNRIHYLKGPGIGNDQNSSATITNNEIWQTRRDAGNHPGIGLSGDVSPTIENNIAFEAYTGIGGNLTARGGTLTVPALKGNKSFENHTAGISFGRLAGDTGTINVTIGASGTENENHIYDNESPGISLSGGDSGVFNATIDNNKIHGNGYVSNGNAGIFLQHRSNQVIIKHNEIYSNGYWYEVSGSVYSGQGGGIYNHSTYASSHVGIYDNDIHENSRGGIRIGNASDGTAGATDVIGNEIYKNEAGGIRIETGTGTIAQNTIHDNSAGGIGFHGTSSPDYYIIKNNIYANGGTPNEYHVDSFPGGGIGSAYGGGFSVAPILRVRQNRVYDHQSRMYDLYGGGGIQLRSNNQETTNKLYIENNLVHDNIRGGIRFGQEDAWDSTNPVRNNTVVGNGSGAADEVGYGGGILYGTNYAYYRPEGTAPDSLVVKNNILAYNKTPGLRVGGSFFYVTDDCPDNTNLTRDYNLYFYNHRFSPVPDEENGFQWDDVAGYDGTCWDAGNAMCANQQAGGCWSPGPFPPYAPHSMMADPDFVNGPDDTGDDDYHLESGSVAKDGGEGGIEMGCYGGNYPMNNLMDVDEGTGNTNSDGTYVTFDLGATASYTITDVRLYTSSTSMTWDVWVGSTIACSTQVKNDWAMSSAGWHETTVSPQPTNTRYIKLESNGVSVPAAAIFEFSYKKNEDATFYWDGSQFWRTPSIVADSTYTDIDG